MDPEYIKNLTDEVKTVLTVTESMARELQMLKRVLKQAVLTHGGELVVDVLLADAAENEKRQLFIGSGKITLETVYYCKQNEISQKESSRGIY